MKRFLFIAMSAILAVSMSACKFKKDISVVSVDGSTSMEKVVGYLSEVYMEEHSGVKVTFNPTGSSAGIQAVADGRCDIGLSSRELKDEEEISLLSTVIALDGIAVIVNNDNPVSDLAVEKIRKIYMGKISNWNELGGEDAPIVCVGREAASGTRDGFEMVLDIRNKCRYTQELTSAGDVVQVVASNPNAIGYTSLDSVKGNVKVLTVDGVKAQKETIQSGEYKLQRNFNFVTKKDVQLSDEAQSFFDFSVSGLADNWIIKAGAIPVSR